MNERRFRLDFVIALGALLISTVAAAATVYQTRVIASQFSATVWPYVSFDITNAPTSFDLELRNDGLGPAIVRSATLSLDGHEQPSLEVLMRTLVLQDPKTLAAMRRAARIRALKVTTSTPTAGEVIPAGTSRPVIRIDGAAFALPFRDDLPRIGLTLCYCSLTGNCWRESYRSRESEPEPVSGCSGRS
jgi:hypothetical protein